MRSYIFSMGYPSGKHNIAEDHTSLKSVSISAIILNKTDSFSWVWHCPVVTKTLFQSTFQKIWEHSPIKTIPVVILNFFLLSTNPQKRPKPTVRLYILSDFPSLALSPEPSGSHWTHNYLKRVTNIYFNMRQRLNNFLKHLDTVVFSNSNRNK